MKREVSNIQLIKNVFYNDLSKRIGVVLFWLAIWEFVSLCLSQPLFLPSPIVVIKTTGILLVKGESWIYILTSLSHILFGLLSGIFLATLLAICAFRNSFFSDLIRPLILVMKSVPVASLIILLLFYLKTGMVSTVIVLLIVLPIFYTNLLEGLVNMSPELNEMATVFRIPLMKKIRGIYLPQLLPFVVASSKVCLGLSWKAGVAAEVIAVLGGTIGAQLYLSKVYLEAPLLFSWTLIILLLSFSMEKIIISVIKLAFSCLEELN